MRKMFSEKQIKNLAVESVNQGIESGAVKSIKKISLDEAQLFYTQDENKLKCSIPHGYMIAYIVIEDDINGLALILRYDFGNDTVNTSGSDISVSAVYNVDNITITSTETPEDDLSTFTSITQIGYVPYVGVEG